MKPHFGQPIVHQGEPIENVKHVMIMVHGRGALPQSILALTKEFSFHQISYLAPAAAERTWYPYSFLAPIQQNEPGISSGIFTLSSLVNQIIEKGILKEHIFLLGFSQGACLASEFLARNADQYGGLFVLSGGLIGPKGTPRDYSGNLKETPIFLGCSDVDAHVPKWRVDESAEIFEQMGAKVEKRIYPGMPHTINKDEIHLINELISKKIS